MALAVLAAAQGSALGGEPSCALYGLCRPPGGDAFTPRSVNCANAPGAVAPATPAFNLTACPEYQGAACCNEAQVRRPQREAQRTRVRPLDLNLSSAARGAARQPRPRGDAVRALPRVRGGLPAPVVRLHVLAAPGAQLCAVASWPLCFPLSRPYRQGSFVNVTSAGFYDDTAPPRGVAVADVARFDVTPAFADALCVALALLAVPSSPRDSTSD